MGFAGSVPGRAGRLVCVGWERNWLRSVNSCARSGAADGWVRLAFSLCRKKSVCFRRGLCRFLRYCDSTAVGWTRVRTTARCWEQRKYRPHISVTGFIPACDFSASFPARSFRMGQPRHPTSGVSHFWPGRMAAGGILTSSFSSGYPGALRKRSRSCCVASTSDSVASWFASDSTGM
jgi:hypothetical protein